MVMIFFRDFLHLAIYLDEHPVMPRSVTDLIQRQYPDNRICASGNALVFIGFEMCRQFFSKYLKNFIYFVSVSLLYFLTTIHHNDRIVMQLCANPITVIRKVDPFYLLR